MRWMMILAAAALLAVRGAAGDSAAVTNLPALVPGFTVPATTSPPFTYGIEYLPDPGNPDFLGSLGASPPDLFHLGYQIPFKGALGPTYGHQLFSDDILPPDEIPREVERIQDILGKMRRAGVDRLIPYVYTMAFFGNPDTRTGFFHFYDHWDEYRAFGLGPKPAADPTLWSQVPGPRPLGGGSPDVLHYDPCVNNPGWQDFLDLVVRQLALVGYDGMFFDVNNEYCYCPHCQEGFDIYLLNKYGRAGLRETFGTDDARALNIPTIYRDFEGVILKEYPKYLAGIWDQEYLSAVLGVKEPSDVKLDEDWRLLRCFMEGSLGEFPPEDAFDAYLERGFGAHSAAEASPEKRVDFGQAVLRRQFHRFLTSPALAQMLQTRFGSSDIRRRCCGAPRDLLLWVEAQRFWCNSMASLFARLKADGQAMLSEQGRHENFFTVANLGSMATVDSLNKRRVDAIDLVRWARVADMQMFEEMPQPGSLESGVILSNIFAFRWAMAAGTRAGTLLYKVQDDAAADLAEAEAAAGGGGAFIQPGLAAPESRRRWKQFFAQHADLWDGGTSCAEVGVLFWSDEVFYEYPEHLAMVRGLVHVLSESQVPFDIVTEEHAPDLASYRVVIAPMLRYLDGPQIESLLAYAKQGGTLVVVEPFGTEDKRALPRQSDPLAGACPAADDFKPVPWGSGRIVRLHPDAVPKRESDVWRLMEERGGAFVRARDFLDSARDADKANGVDLGAHFIRLLEECLGATLRWCPPETDAGVYVHAYRVPAKAQRPERLVLHLVNYRMPIVLAKAPRPDDDPSFGPVTKSGEPEVIRDLRVTAPLPRNATVKRVDVLSPTDSAQDPGWEIQDERVVLNVSQLRVYQAVVVELAKSSDKT